MYDNNINDNINQDVASINGVTLKTIIGLFIAFFVAMPRLAAGKYFGEFFFRGGFLGDIIGSIIFTAIVGFIWFFLVRSLQKDKGSLLNALVYGITCVFAGIFMANSLIVATNVISYYGELDVDTIKSALKIAGLVTFIAVFAGVMILPRIKMTGKTVKFARNAAVIVAALALSSFVLYIVGNILALFGATFLLDLYWNTLYGVGPFSIILSIFFVFLAEVLFLGVLAGVKYSVGKSPKHYEYFLAISLVNGILELYVEIFKLILKLMARNRRD